MFVAQPVDAREGDAQPEQQAASEPQRGTLAVQPVPHGPPETSKKVAPRMMPPRNESAGARASFILVLRIAAKGPVFSSHPVPRVEAADSESRH